MALKAAAETGFPSLSRGEVFRQPTRDPGGGGGRTVEWYRAWHEGEVELHAPTVRQVEAYVKDAQAAGRAWAV